MDGDIAPLDKLYEIAKAHDIILMVDDAHGEGVLGKGGRGIVDHFNLHGKVDIEVGTFSKAFGVVGGVVLRQRGHQSNGCVSAGAPSCSPPPSLLRT
jgi:glycine C-acetyltransferase